MSEFLIKSSVTMAVLLGLYYLLFEREKMHRFNRFYLLSALAFSLVLPLITIPVYVEPETVPQTIELQQFPVEIKMHHPSQPGVTTKEPVVIIPEPVTKPKVNYWPYIGFGIYLLVTIVLAVRFIINIVHFLRLKRNNGLVNYKGVSIILLNAKVLPHTFLSNIYLNKQDYEDRIIDPVLFTHEMAHVNQRHTLDILFVETLKTFFWFNPLLYFYKRAIQLNHEFLADEKVIAATANTTYYQSLLLEKVSAGKIFPLASNLNFSLTKKRLLMMTKTTNKIKSIALKMAVMPVAVSLVYLISTETVIAKGKAHGAAILFNPVTGSNSIESLNKEDTLTESPALNTIKDTADGDARRDEYFKRVQIVIDDKPKGVLINKPYEKLTMEEQRYYLSNIPEKEQANGLQISDYNSFIGNEDGAFYIDNKKVTRDEILKHRREYFACGGSKRSGSDKRYFFYTYPYFSKYIKTLNDHYPDKTYKITILNEVLEYQPDDAPAEKKTYERNGDTSEKDGYTVEVSYMRYGYTDETKSHTSEIMAHFPGGNDKFNDYLFSNLQVPEKLKQEEIMVSFVINTDGSLSDIFVDEKLDSALAEEVKRIMLISPKWIPAQKNGKPSLIGTRLYFKNKS